MKQGNTSAWNSKKAQKENGKATTDADKRLEQGIEALKKGVKCPYCKAGSDKIDVGLTTVTLLYPLPHLPPTYDPNTYATKYACRNCGKRFWIRRKVEPIEEYVYDEKG
jgi:DNA-directed RNA polymerase subunit RPC12/RpoP